MDKRKGGDMTLRDTIGAMQQLIEELAKDLQKSSRGNKAAARRVRVGTVQMEKLAKQYRKESVIKRKKIVKPVKKTLSSRRMKSH